MSVLSEATQGACDASARKQGFIHQKQMDYP